MEPLPPYASTRERAGRIAFISFCALILLFLIFPLLVIIPISFTSGATLTLEPEMLALEREAFSWRWYEAFLADEGWRRALYNSFTISPVAALIATVLGTMAALGLSQSQLPFKGVIMGVLISPMIVPLIISATGMYFFYSRLGLQGTYWGVVLAHAVLGVPFVIITVTATLTGFDNSLTRASASLGAGPLTTFFRVQAPLILPGVVSGGLFAFITAFDEVIVVLFVGAQQQKTLPWQMFLGLREEISPAILAVATLLVFLSIALLLVVEALRRRSERLRGISG